MSDSTNPQLNRAEQVFETAYDRLKRDFYNQGFDDGVETGKARTQSNQEHANSHLLQAEYHRGYDKGLQDGAKQQNKSKKEHYNAGYNDAKADSRCWGCDQPATTCDSCHKLLIAAETIELLNKD